MRIMIIQNLLLSCSCLLILVHFLQTCHANQNTPRYCSPSSCGIIQNISFPFRLKGDPEHCGYPCYELVCEDNVASIYLNSNKYQVKAINHNNSTIRLADASTNNTNTCSFPNYSVHQHNFSYDSPYSTCSSNNNFCGHGRDIAWPINFISCPYPLKNSSLFTETTGCANYGGDVFDASISSRGRHTYIKVGHMNASEVKHMCRMDLIVLTSWKFKDFKNVSVSEIHDSLLYGFELSWFRFCRKCRGRWVCAFTEDEVSWCFYSITAAVKAYLILVLILVLFFGVSIPGMIFLFTFFLGTAIFRPTPLFAVWAPFSVWDFLLPSELTYLRLLVKIGVILAIRIIIALPCLMGLLIYRFRRRRLSMFDVIEGFLRSDNKLMPIRYYYSDIKKMTRGFREKLGEGGYGSVYKGKLRSGHEVAVKLLEKPRANGQDFINEIATIGRIHHVNVVQLVGYCAERSKRALVYDFMPNGSLEKHIFGREKAKSLSWKTKFEIAVGVAQGIEYLHRGCDIQILHFDIKPHNILLDEKFIPKVSDFGLAKFFSTEKNTVTLTAARGTIGYVAPELINRGIGGVSYKADVYSFGMLLMEMVGLKRDMIGNNENSSQYFPYWIYDCFNQGKDIEIEKADDENDDDGNESNRKIVRKMTIVALWCIQMRPDDRPSMNKVVEMLEGEVERLQIPPQTSYSPQVAVNEDQTCNTCSTDSISWLSHDAAPSVEITVQDL